jgi:hypothetical protein
VRQQPRRVTAGARIARVSNVSRATDPHKERHERTPPAITTASVRLAASL